MSPADTILNLYALKLADRLGGDSRVFLFWKGRVALYAILRAFGVKEGDEVIVPVLTCVVVPNAVMYLGARPVYVEVDHSAVMAATKCPYTFRGTIKDEKQWSLAEAQRAQRKPLSLRCRALGRLLQCTACDPA